MDAYDCESHNDKIFRILPLPVIGHLNVEPGYRLLRFDCKIPQQFEYTFESHLNVTAK